MKNSFYRFSPALLCVAPLISLAPAFAQGTTTNTTPKVSKTPLSTEDKVKAEFADWRYAGAKISASFQRGPLSLLSVTTADDMEKVWKHYMTLIPNENKVPLTYSWEIPGENTLMGANYKLGSSFAVSLNSAPREAGTIVYQKGPVNIVIEIRARTPEQIAESGVHTDIKLIKMRPLDAPQPGKVAGNPVQGAATPATTW